MIDCTRRSSTQSLEHWGKMAVWISAGRLMTKNWINSPPTQDVRYGEEPSQSETDTARVLTSLGVTTYTDEDIETVRRICSLVCVRAAFLAAAILATLINRVNQPEVTIVVDGDLYQRHPRFHELMYNKTLELVEPGLKFNLVSPCCEKSIGAARIAAASLRLRNTR